MTLLLRATSLRLIPAAAFLFAVVSAQTRIPDFSGVCQLDLRRSKIEAKSPPGECRDHLIQRQKLRLFKDTPLPSQTDGYMEDGDSDGSKRTKRHPPRWVAAVLHRLLRRGSSATQGHSRQSEGRKGCCWESGTDRSACKKIPNEEGASNAEPAKPTAVVKPVEAAKADR